MKKILTLLLISTAISASAQWQQTNGPGGGYISSLSSNGTKLFAGTYYGGVYISDYFGLNWNNFSIDSLSQVESITAIASNGNTLFAGTYNKGIYLSSDNGISWTLINNGLTNLYITAIQICGNNILAATFGGLFISSNYGTNWTQVKSGHINSIAQIGNKIYIGQTSTGVSVSTDYGLTWTSTSFNNFSVTTITVSDTIIFAGTYSSGVFRSNDYGNTWTQVNYGLTAAGMSVPVIQALATCGTTIFAAVSGNGWTGYCTSVDNGNNWALSTSELADKDITFFATISNSIFAATLENGIFMSNDFGSTWTEENTGIANSGVKVIATIGNYIFTGTNYNISKTSDNGNTWENHSLEYTDIFALETNGTNLYAATDKGLFTTGDYGTNWNLLAFQDTGVTALYVDASTILIGTDAYGVFISSDNGTTWQSIGLSIYYITSVVKSGNHIFACGYDDGLFSTTDFGQNWASVDTSILAENLDISFCKKDNKLLAASTSGLFSSDNDGTSWTQLISNMAVRKAYIFDSTIFILNFNGNIYYTDLNGNNLTSFNDGFYESGVYCLAAINDTIFAGTWEQGVWKRSLQEINSVSEIHKNQHISIFPNPAISEIWISSPANSEVEIYNTTGILLKRIVISENPTSINISNLNQGIYIVKIKSDNYIKTEKIIKK